MGDKFAPTDISDVGAGAQSKATDDVWVNKKEGSAAHEIKRKHLMSSWAFQDAVPSEKTVNVRRRNNTEK